MAIPAEVRPPQNLHRSFGANTSGLLFCIQGRSPMGVGGLGRDGGESIDIRNHADGMKGESYV